MWLAIFTFKINNVVGVSKPICRFSLTKFCTFIFSKIKTASASAFIASKKSFDYSLLKTIITKLILLNTWLQRDSRANISNECINSICFGNIEFFLKLSYCRNDIRVKTILFDERQFRLKYLHQVWIRNCRFAHQT